MTTLTEFLQKYKDAGLSFFPVPLGKKEANIKWQVYQKRRPTNEEINQWTNGFKTNIAVVCGAISDNLTVLDCDSIDRFYELAEIICQKTGVSDILDFTTVSQTGKGMHIWLKTKDPIKSQKFPKLDIKGEGSYICFTAGHKIVKKGQGISYNNRGHNSLIDISKLKKNDILLAYDEQTGEIVDTIVQKCSQRKVKETYIIKFGKRNGAIRLTGEHPLYTTNGWKQAKDIIIGDELFYLDLTDLHLPVPIHNFPKGKQAQPKEIRVKGRYTQTPYKQTIPSHRIGMSNYEGFLLSIAHEIGIPLKFVGDGSLIINNKGFRLAPDFIIEGTKKLVEVSIDWHKHNLNGAPKTALRNMSWEERHQLFNNAGYEVLFIDATEWGAAYNNQTLSLINKLRKELREYSGNGLRVDFIHKVIENVSVFNIHCEPYHNFFVHRLNKGTKYILAHNCAPPSLHPNGAEYKFVNKAPIQRVESLMDIGIDIKKPGEPHNEPGWVSHLLAGVREGYRNDSAIKLAGYFRNTQSQDITERILLDWNAKNIPPLPENVLLRTIKSAYNLPEHPPPLNNPPPGALYIYNDDMPVDTKTRQNKTTSRQKTGMIPLFAEEEENDTLCDEALNTKKASIQDNTRQGKTKARQVPDIKAGQGQDKVGADKTNLAKTERPPDSYAGRFDQFLSEAGGRVDKREVAEAIGLKVTSDYFRRLLARRKQEGKVRAFRGSHYLIEWISRDFVVTHLDNIEAEPMLDIFLPLRIHEYASLPPRSLVGIAGMTSSGKTSFLLELAELNVISQPLPVYYWYNEMSEAKMIYRCEDFPLLIEAWKAGKFFPVMQSKFEFADVLQPDAINLIDYLDREDNLFLIGDDIKKLYNALNSGVVIFALQKKAHLVLGYGGVPSIKLSNLYIALDIKYQSGISQHCTAKIVKCKDWKKLDTNPNSLYCEYHTGGKHGKLFLDEEWKPKKR